MEADAAPSAEPTLAETSSSEALEHDDAVKTPIAIYRIGAAYHLFDAAVILYLRTHYNIPGVLTGSLPQSPQQNVFLGLPVQLMPEEARLLVERDVCVIVDSVQAQRHGLRAIGREGRKAWKASLEERGRLEGQRRADDAKRKAVEFVGTLKGEKGEKARKALGLETIEHPEADSTETLVEDDSSLFSPAAPAAAPHSRTPRTIDAPLHHITPTTSSYLPYPPLESAVIPHLPPVPSSYPLYAHLHDKGYFLSPGLRFGCQYLAYPGDALRFHSHFLVVSREWDQEIDLQMLVSGGRLGTGVKKGFLLGGQAPRARRSIVAGEDAMEDNDDESDGGFGLHSRRSLERLARAEKPSVRTFCIEWGGM